MTNEDKALTSLRQEFLKHIGSGVRAPFAAPPEMSMAISILTRELEEKREQGSIDDAEDRILDEIERLWGEIERYNRDVRDMKPQYMTERTYKFGGQIVPEDDDAPQSIVRAPKISSAEAEEIIAGLNQQFEEKVMSQIQNKAAVAEGRSLQDYLLDMK